MRVKYSEEMSQCASGELQNLPSTTLNSSLCTCCQQLVPTPCPGLSVVRITVTRAPRFEGDFRQVVPAAFILTSG